VTSILVVLPTAWDSYTFWSTGAMAAERDFGGKTVVITGASGGLGAAYSRRFARAGAQLGLLDLDAARVHAFAAELAVQGVDCVPVACDVTNEGACRAAIAAVIDRFTGIDVLINNAGITHRSAFADTQTVVFRKVMDVNFFGALYCTQAALPSLIARRGLIITISSIAGIAPLFGRSGYAASKYALHGLFDTLRSELAGAGVDVLIVCPGFTATGIGAAALDGDGSITAHPQSTVGKPASPERVAEAVFRAARHGKRLLVLSTVGKTTRLIAKFFPGLYERLMARSLRRELQR
jgi:NAD(P)-dependent dehydrogenase (short-subunit alcohol dehydrogenase family)